MVDRRTAGTGHRDVRTGQAGIDPRAKTYTLSHEPITGGSGAGLPRVRPPTRHSYHLQLPASECGPSEPCPSGRRKCFSIPLTETLGIEDFLTDLAHADRALPPRRARRSSAAFDCHRRRAGFRWHHRRHPVERSVASAQQACCSNIRKCGEAGLGPSIVTVHLMPSNHRGW